MYSWLGASLAWLLGTALQLMSDTPSRAGCALGLALGAVGLLLAFWVRTCLRLPTRAARAEGVGGAGDLGDHADWRWSLASRALAMLGLACLGWGITGWRALDRLAQAWPPDLADQVVQADVRWVGLPQRMPALPSSLRDGQGTEALDKAVGVAVRWQAEARILRWTPSTGPSSGATWPQRVQLFWERPAAEGPPRPGESWRVAMRLRPPDDRVNPGVGDGALGRFSRGVRAVGRVVSAERLPGAQALPRAGWWECRLDAIDAWRQRVRDRVLARVSDARAAGVLAGLSVGDQAAIGQGDWVVLQRTGAAHLVSISGPHVAMLGVLAAWLVRMAWSRLPGLTRMVPAHAVAAWVALSASTLYALAAGWGVPAQRTVWMMAFVTVLGAMGRRWPWPMVWLPGAALVAFADPWALAQPGFWLSFVAVGVLLASGVRVPEANVQTWAEGHWRTRWRKLGSELLATQRLVAVALAPLALVCFQQVSIVGMGVNLLAVPLFTLVFTPLALAGVVWPLCWDIAAWGLQATWWALSVCAKAPGAVWEVPALPGWVAASGVVAAFVLALPGRWRWRVLALPFLLPFFRLPDAWHLLPRPQPGQFDVVVVDVGQGGATLVRTSSHTLLFDAGPLRPDGTDLVERVLSPMLQALGVRRLDALVISHDDADHSGGANSLLDSLEVGQLMTPFDADHALRRRPVAHRACEAGLSWTWDGVVFRMLHPGPPAPRDSDNARSCVLQVEASAAVAADRGQPVRLLLTADIEAEQEQSLLARWPAQTLRSTVALVPHHGSRTSSTPAWLRAVAPRQAVVQVGERNPHGHPSASVMGRHEEAGIPVVTTPACGAFVWGSAELALQGRWPQARRHDARPDAAGERTGQVTTTLGRPALGRCWRATRTRHWQR